ncbi:fumarylacetoacetate hydrolase family protein [Shigella sonnei]
MPNILKRWAAQYPKSQYLSIKPGKRRCVKNVRQPLAIPSDFGSVHHEVELAVLIGATLRQATEEHVRKAIAGYGVALNLTLRDVRKNEEPGSHRKRPS